MGTRDVTISAELLVDLLTGGLDITEILSEINCVKGLPIDASLVAASCIGHQPDLFSDVQIP